MKNIILLALFCLASNFGAIKAEYLQVQNPQQTWEYGNGTIEEATVTVKPAGVYMEVGVYLTYSARGNYFTDADTVEIQHFFDLPANVLVTDSWLWLGDACIKADLIDRWKAGLIYEGIVKRRRDPSILYKNSSTNYEYRIFPMAGASTRKVKLTFMMPLDWSYKNPLLKLPLNLITVSKNLPPVEILVLDDKDWLQPSISGNSSTQFVKSQVEGFGDCWKLDLSNTQYTKNTSIELKQKNPSGIYISKFEEKPKEGYYQIAFSPKQLFDLNDPRKIAVLVDYDAMKTYLTIPQIKEQLKTALINNLTQKDSFNIFFSNLKINKLSQNWIVANPDTIESVFRNIPDNVLSVYSNLQNLVFEGVAFAKQGGANASIFLAASSDQLGYNQTANPFVEDLLKEYDGELPAFYISDFASHPTSYYFSGATYTGNQYLYNALSNMTKGAYFKMNTLESELAIFNKTLNLTNGQILSMDWSASLDSGFTYANYSSDDNANSADNYSSYIYGIGRFWGDKPFKIKVTGFYHGNGFMKETEVIPAQDLSGVSKQLWTGNFILSMEKKQNTNEVTAQIIDLSMKNRVLSLYTAFLALDPSVKPDTVTTDNKTITGVDDNYKPDAGISANAYPNPFDALTTIKIKLDEGLSSENLDVKIIDALGNVVKTINSNDLQYGSEITLNWNGANDNGISLPNGVYWVVIKSAKGVQTLSVVIMR